MLNVFYRFFFKASAFSFKGKITKNSSGAGPAQWSKSGVAAPFPGSRAGGSGARKEMVPRILNLSLDQNYCMGESGAFPQWLTIAGAFLADDYSKPGKVEWTDAEKLEKMGDHERKEETFPPGLALTPRNLPNPC